MCARRSATPLAHRRPRVRWRGMHLEQVVRPVAHMTLATAREPGRKKGHQMSGATVNQGSMQALDPGACLGAVYAAAVMGASSAAPPRRESEVAGPVFSPGGCWGSDAPH